MSTYIFIIISSLMSGASTMFQKLWMKNTRNILNQSEIFALIHVVSTLIFYFILSGGNLYTNMTTLIYSMLFGFFSTASILINLTAMKHMNLVLLSVFSRGSNMTTWLFGILFFRERFSISGIVSTLLIFISILIPLFGSNIKNTKLTDYLLGISIMLLGTANTVLLKLYAVEPLKMSNSILCFYTNVFMALFTIINMLRKTNVSEIFTEFKQVKKQFALIPANSLANCVSTIINMYVLSIMPLSSTTTISYAVGCIVVFINSKLIFKEKCTRSDIIAFILSAAAFFVTLI